MERLMRTTAKLASEISRAFAFDDATKERCAKTLRNIVAQDIVPSEVDPDDRRRTRLIDDASARALVLLYFLAELSIDARGLRDAARVLLADDERTTNAIRAGRNVTFRFGLLSQTKDECKHALVRWCDFEVEGESQDIAGKIVEDWKSGSIVFPISASHLLTPFLTN